MSTYAQRDTLVSLGAASATSAPEVRAADVGPLALLLTD